MFYALPPLLKNEKERQSAVDRHGAASKRLSVIQAAAAEAANLFDVHIGVASIIDRSRMVAIAAHGLDLEEVRRDVAFCSHTIADGSRVLCLPDTAEDKRFAGNPLVRGAPGIRFYAGAPLVTAEGHVLGALCAMDATPHDRPTDAQTEALQALAAEVVAALTADEG
jgi:GAF domain-containing protein